MLRSGRAGSRRGGRPGRPIDEEPGRRVFAREANTRLRPTTRLATSSQIASCRDMAPRWVRSMSQNGVQAHRGDPQQAPQQRSFLFPRHSRATF
jgi:hypothetical protein